MKDKEIEKLVGEERLDRVEEKAKELVEIHDEALEEYENLGNREEFRIKLAIISIAIDHMLREMTKTPAEGAAYLKVVEELFKEHYKIKIKKMGKVMGMDSDLKSMYG